MRRIVMSIVLAVALTATASPVLAQTPPPPNFPEELRVAGTGPTLIRWAWYGGSCDEGFRVALSTSRDMSQPRFRTVSTNWATFTGLTPGRNYYASVRCRIGSTYSAPTEVVAGRAGVVGTPRWTGRTSTSITFAWIPYEGAKRYEYRFSRFSDVHVFRSGKQFQRSRTFERLAHATYYYVKVRALNGAGEAISGWSPIGRGSTEY